MKTAPALTPSIIRLLARDLAARLATDGAAARRAQPGRLAFPKHIHELGVTDGETPDGLSPDYLALAARLNRRARSGTADGDALAMLFHVVEVEITRARLAESALLTALERLE